MQKRAGAGFVAPHNLQMLPAVVVIDIQRIGAGKASGRQVESLDDTDIGKLRLVVHLADELRIGRFEEAH
jgi:hypothetical protein